ncbi:MAG: LCP family protein, partial [Anaerolineaceae bacterium]|nr:LCP family protein [Anaerolineaceae bacterium]
HMDPMGHYQPIRVQRPRRAPRRTGCACFGLGVLLAACLVLVYFLAPLRTNLLILGIDNAPEGTYVGRSDTIILVSVVPLRPDVAMLSIPRDLYLEVPGHGLDRINTAHFYAEAEQAGSGPAAATSLVSDAFGVPLHYYVRLRFDSVLTLIDALGGVEITLDEPTAGYPAGRHLLSAAEALAFARSRAGSDDFYRMAQGQLLIQAAIQRLAEPATWLRLPQILSAAGATLDTNVPVWQWPRLGLALLRGFLFDAVDSRTLPRDLVQPFVTGGGAQVLLPQWELIHPLIHEMFGY